MIYGYIEIPEGYWESSCNMEYVVVDDSDQMDLDFEPTSEDD